MKQQIRVEIIEKMFQRTSSSEVLYNALKILLPKKKELKRFVGTVVVCSIPAYLIGFSSDTVKLFLNGVQIINEIIVALFGIAFTGYALFQALVGSEMLKKMLSNTTGKGDKEKCKLQESNEIFVETMMLQLFCILINLFILVVGASIPEDFGLLKELLWNNIIAGVALEIYFYISATTIMEMKSFIYNIFQLFNLHAGTRAVEILKEKE